MPSYSGGTAYITIIPSLRGFAAKAKSELSGIRLDVQATIKPTVDQSALVRAQAELAAAMKASTAAQNAQIAASRTLQSARDSEATAVGKVRLAEQQLVEVRANSRSQTSQVIAAEERLNTAHRSLEQAQRATAASASEVERAQTRVSSTAKDFESAQRRVSSAMSDAERFSRRLGSALSDLGAHRGEIAALDNAVSGVGRSMVSTAASALKAAAAVEAIGVAAQGIAGLGSVIADLSKGALLLPGAFAATGAALGTLVVGNKGVITAFKDLSTAEKDSGQTAATTARQQQQAASQIANAESSVANAEQELTQAQRTAKQAQDALTQARQQAQRSLEDLANQVRDGALAERQAVLDLQADQQNLNQTLANPSATQQQRQQAQLTYDQQVQQLSEIRLQNQRLASDKTAADRAGVEGSQQVVAAQQQIVTATDSVTRAQRSLADAQRQLADALTKTGETGTASVNKLATAMAGLAPNARAFVNTVHDMQGAFSSLKVDVQQRLFAGLAEDVRSLGAQYLPILKTGMGAVADSFSYAAGQAVAFARDATTAASVGGLFTSTSQIVRNLANGLQPILTGLRDIGTVGVRYIADATTGFGALGQRFADWAKQVADSGKLMADFRTFGSDLRDLGDIAKNVASSLGSIFRAANVSGASFLGTIKSVTGELSTFLRSSSGQSSLASFFTGLKAAADNLKPALSAVFSALGDSLRIIGPALPGVATSIAKIVESLAPALPALASIAVQVLPPIAKAIASLGPALPYVAAGFIAVVGAIKGLLAVATVVTALQKVKTGLDTLGNVTSKFSGASDAADKATASTSKFGSSMSTAAKALPVLGLAVTGLIEGWKAVVGSNDDLVSSLNQGGEAAGNASGQIARNTYVVNTLKKAIPPLGDAFAALMPTLDSVGAEVEKQRAAMTGLQRAQQDATIAQANYLQAVDQFGKDSWQAIQAQEAYTGSVHDVEDAQWRAEEATKTTTEKIQEQRNAELGSLSAGLQYQQSLLDIKQAQNDYTTALKQYGASSDQAKQANLRLQQSYLQAVQAAQAKARQDAAGLPPSEQAQKVATATTQAILQLAAAAGTTAPPALQQLVASLGQSEIAAYQSTQTIDGTHQAVVELPDGKQINIVVDQSGLPVLAQYKKAIDDLPGISGPGVKNFTYVFDSIVNGKNVSGPGPLANLNDILGGALTHAYGGVIPGYAPGRDTVPAMLSPGEAVLVPELVRQIGPSAILTANARASARRFSTGGIVGLAAGGVVAPPAVVGTDVTTPQGAQALTSSLSTLADTVTSKLASAFTGFLTQLGQLSTTMLSLQQTIGSVWTGITSSIVGALDVIDVRQDISVVRQTTAFATLRAALSAVRDAMTQTAAWAQIQFGLMWEYAAGPARQILAGPFNAGIIAAWNALNADFGLNHPVAPVAIPFATGGTVPGSGNGDTVPALLTPGEYVIPKQVVQRWGLDNIQRAHRAAITGSRAGLEGMFSGDEANLIPVQRFAVGGAVQAGLNFARAQAGKPYVWGGVGPGGFDCSGLVSAVTNVLRGQYPYRRLGVAASQPWPGFQPGLGGVWSTGFNPTHTAGTLAGVNIESAVSPIVFPGLHGADSGQFSGHAWLPELAGSFVSGGDGAFDPTPFVNTAFSATYGMISSAAALRDLMSQDGAGVARIGADDVRQTAVSQISALTSSVGAAGSPEVVAAVRAVANTFGWGSGPEWDALSWVIAKESGWNPTAANPTSSARGLFQKMTSIFGPLEPTPTGQAQWGLPYIKGRYGDPIAAKAFHVSHGYYDDGGWLPPGVSTVYNGTGKPEPVFTSEQWTTLSSQRGGDFTGSLYLDSGEFLGKVRGEIDSANGRTATAIRRGTRA